MYLHRVVRLAAAPHVRLHHAPAVDLGHVPPLDHQGKPGMRFELIQVFFFFKSNSTPFGKARRFTWAGGPRPWRCR